MGGEIKKAIKRVQVVPPTTLKKGAQLLASQNMYHFKAFWQNISENRIKNVELFSTLRFYICSSYGAVVRLVG